MTKIIMRGEYACLIQRFISKEETRYYLNGFYVHADPAQGIRIVATDGHKMAIFRDELGEIDGGSQIVKLPKIALDMLKPTYRNERLRRGKSRRVLDSQKWLQIDGDPVRCTASIHECDPRENADMQMASFSRVLIDGTFPDYQRVVPSWPETPVGRLDFNASLVADFGSVTEKKGVHRLHFEPTGNGNPVLVLADRPDFLGVLMPVAGANAKPGLPDWFAVPKAKAA